MGNQKIMETLLKELMLLKMGQLDVYIMVVDGIQIIDLQLELGKK